MGEPQKIERSVNKGERERKRKGERGRKGEENGGRGKEKGRRMEGEEEKRGGEWRERKRKGEVCGQPQVSQTALHLGLKCLGKQRLDGTTTTRAETATTCGCWVCQRGSV